MRIVFLDTDTLGDDLDVASFARFGTLVTYGTTLLEETQERIRDACIVVTNKVKITEAHIAQTSSLKLICVAATGMNNVDLEAAKQARVIVKNVAGYSTHSVVQHTFTMLFYLMGQSRYYDDYVKNGVWQSQPLFTHIGPSFHELYGKKWGIIGMGAIGSAVAKVAQAFGAEVSYYSTSGANDAQPYPRVDLDTLMATCDIVSIHAPLNAQTQNLLGLESLRRLKEGAALLNLGRGGIIDEAALARIMREKELYVGLDVLAFEPIQAGHPLLAYAGNRLYITPHIAWTSIEARARLLARIEEHIETFQKEHS